MYFLCGLRARWMLSGQSQDKLDPNSGSHQIARTTQEDSGTLFQLRHFQKVPKPGCFDPDVSRASSVSCAFLQAHLQKWKAWRRNCSTWILKHIEMLGITQMMALGKSISKDTSTEICHLIREKPLTSNAQELHKLQCTSPFLSAKSFLSDSTT